MIADPTIWAPKLVKFSFVEATLLDFVLVIDIPTMGAEAGEILFC